MGISQDKKVTNDKLFRNRSFIEKILLDYFVPLSFRVEQYKLVLKKKKKSKTQIGCLRPRHKLQIYLYFFAAISGGFDGGGGGARPWPR